MSFEKTEVINPTPYNNAVRQKTFRSDLYITFAPIITSKAQYHEQKK